MSGPRARGGSEPPSEVATVIGFAGRRIDAADADVARFPLTEADAVRERVRELFVRRRVMCLVSSAACGADLLALEAAGALGVRRVVVLPFETDAFRRTSVVDRPGAERWGASFDRLVREVPAGDLITLDGAETDAAAYEAASTRILREAVAIADALRVRALAAVAWDGVRRGPDDMTARFLDDARSLGVETEEIATLPDGRERS